MTATKISANQIPGLAGLSDVNVTEGSGIDKFALVFDNASGKWLAVARPYDFAFSIVGTTINGEKIVMAVVRAATIPINATGSIATASVAATGSTVFTIKQNGTQIGTITFAASATTGTFSFSSAVTFAAGDLLEIDAPATADATLANIAITLKGSW